MGAWEAECKRQLEMLALGDASLLVYLNGIFETGSERSHLHLAIFVEPYLTYILEGKKTVESRFSSVRCAPYDKVQAGDVILLKKAGGPVSGVCRASSAWFYEINRSSLTEIRREFAQQICPAEPDFWSARKDTCFATLISLSDVKRLQEFSVRKRDRRGWVRIE